VNLFLIGMRVTVPPGMEPAGVPVGTAGRVTRSLPWAGLVRVEFGSTAAAYTPDELTIVLRFPTPALDDAARQEE